MNPDFGGDWKIGGFLILFILFTNLTLLNLVTGVIVENVLEIASKAEDTEIKKMRKEQALRVKTLKDVFDLIDVDKNKTIDMSEFVHGMKDEKLNIAQTLREIQCTVR